MTPKIHLLGRRTFLIQGGTALGAAALGVSCREPGLISPAWPGALFDVASGNGPGCKLNPNDPASSGFEKIGGGIVTPGTPLKTTDPSPTDNAGLFCNDPAIATMDVEVEAMLRVASFANPPGGADVGVWLAIGDGDKRVILACAIINGETGVGLPALDEPYFVDSFRDPTDPNRLRFVPAPLTANTTVVFRRRASDGAGILLSVNGVPAGVPEIPRGIQPSADRPGTVVELGSLSIGARSDGEFRAFESRPVAGMGLTLTQVQIKPAGAEKVQVQGTLMLAPGGSIDPASERVLLSILRSGVQEYPTAAFPYTGITNGFGATANGWALNQAGRDQSHAQSFVIERTADPRVFNFNFVDTQSSIAQADYAQATIRLEMGGDDGSGTVALRQQSSGNWVYP